MKYALLVGDGMADRPLQEFGGRTPLEEASTPNMDEVAQKGASGLALTIPWGMPPGSDVANMSLMGYDPRRYYTGRGPLEAASMGVDLDGRVAFRLNLVTEEDGRMADYSAGHITTTAARLLVDALREKLRLDVYVGISYRHLLVMEGGEWAICMPPHDVIGSPIIDILPGGEESEELIRIVESSRGVLREHPVNLERIQNGQRPANLAWPWGQGKAPDLPTLKERYGIEGAVICAVDLIRGLGVYAGLKTPMVPEATGYLDTDYKAKARVALCALEDLDFVFVHVEAPDEAGHMGNTEEKVRAIERFDADVVGPILDGIDGRVMVVPDHATPIEVRTHTQEPVPYAAINIPGTPGRCFSERGVADCVVNGWDLIGLLVGGSFEGKS